MKTLGFALTILFVCTAVVPVGADTCIKQKRHMDEYYYGGIVTPEENSETEFWFGGKKTAVFTANRSVIIDAGKGVLIFANHLDSTYVETTLPFDWSNVVDENTLGLLERYRTEGNVKATDETKEVLGRKCKLYEIETWIENDGTKFNQREERLWMSDDLPIDWEAYGKITVNTLRLMNWDDALIEAFTTGFNGFTMASDADVYQQGFSVKETEIVVEVIETQPETDVYSLPSFFKKKDQLTLADLRD
jgi:hypothetical protein